MPKPTIEWVGGVEGLARIIDQTRLPLEYATVELATPEEMFEAIRVLCAASASPRRPASRAWPRRPIT